MRSEELRGLIWLRTFGLDAPIWSWAHAMEMNSGPCMTSIAFLACKR